VLDGTPLGRQFRALRTARGLSLTEVAEATQISTSFLSLFETGKSDITFGRLARLVAFFGISITDLIPDPEPSQTVVVRRDARRQIASESEHAAIQLLTHHTRHKLLPVIVTLEPGGSTAATTTPAGGELFVLLLKGEVEILSAGEGAPVRLRGGDAAYYLTDRERTFRNVGRGRAEWVAVQTPATL
jgi:transcriptional regulator with XRE-family HTH domain